MLDNFTMKEEFQIFVVSLERINKLLSALVFIR